MRKKKNEIFTIIKGDILNNAKSYFIVVVIFVIGIFLGVMLINQTKEKSEIEKYINTYIDETKSLQNGDYFKELQNDVKNNRHQNHEDQKAHKIFASHDTCHKCCNNKSNYN